jgi:cytochrome c-type biogenesis protein CcmH/NrfG
VARAWRSLASQRRAWRTRPVPRENPNRYRGLYGAARAAEVAGDRSKAVGYYEKLVALAGKADTARPEIARAKTFLGPR